MVASQFEEVQRERVAVIFPGALGDFLCLLPALEALRATSRTVLVVARRDWLDLISEGPYETQSIERRGIAELFGVGPLEDAPRLLKGFTEVHSWSGNGDPGFLQRVRAANPTGRCFIHPFRNFRPREHAVEYYARCLDVRPSTPRLWIAAEDRTWAARWCAQINPENRRILALHAGSGGHDKNWDGFQSLVSRCLAEGGIAVEIRGPAENGSPKLAGTHGVLEMQRLTRVAALIEQSSCFAGNDSGITHLAAACGAAGVALFGPSSSDNWKPRSRRLRVLVSREPCTVCGTRLCTHNLREDLVWKELQLSADNADRRSYCGQRALDCG